MAFAIEALECRRRCSRRTSSEESFWFIPSPSTITTRTSSTNPPSSATVSSATGRNVLIGTPDWELELGTGVTKGFSFGTFTLRAAVEHDFAEDETALGEAALEWVKRISPEVRVYLGVEGSEDEREGSQKCSGTSIARRA